MVGTTEAAYLLDISGQRLRQLLKAGRVVGAVKVGRYWRIPLFNEMPKIVVINRGTKGTWRKRPAQAFTNIHVYKQRLEGDRNNKTNSPVIIVQQGDRVTHCRSAYIDGPSRIVYQPFNTLRCSGARLWIEVEPSVPVTTYLFPEVEMP